MTKRTKKTKPEDILAKYRCTVEQALAMEPMEFVTKHLFPFMRRESGFGFAMQDWLYDFGGAPLAFLDGLKRRAPACGTAACIGGSTELILGSWDSMNNRRIIAAVLGLPNYAAYALFFNWLPNHGDANGHWPLDLAIEFQKAHTAIAKEKVAEKVIIRAIETGGTCFLRSLY